MKGEVYWFHNRTFIVGTVGHKYLTGLVIEGDGLHTLKVPVTEKLAPAMYHGQPYPARKMRGHLRKMVATSKSAAVIRKELLANG